MPTNISNFFGKTVSTTGVSTASSFGIGTDTSLGGSIFSLGPVSGTDVNVTTVSTTTATSIVGIATANFRSARVQVQITQGTSYQASDVLLIHDGTTPSIIEYGSIATGSYLANYSTDISSGNARLLVTMNSASSATVKTVAQKITL